MSDVGRLALRVEGDWWVAYYALPDSMDDALCLAQIHMSVVQDKERKQAFMDLLSSFVGGMIEEKTGEHPDWFITPAPENERSGSA